MVYEDKLLYCLNFLKDRTREEFEEITAGQNPEIRKAMDTLYELSADKKVRAEYEMRQKAWMDRQSQFDGYYKKGLEKGMEKSKIETARNMKALGVSTDVIAKLTDLAPEEITKL